MGMAWKVPGAAWVTELNPLSAIDGGFAGDVFYCAVV